MMSETIGALAAALSKFQGEVGAASKNAQNPHLKNKYADLASIWEAIREPLAANGLAVTQCPEPGDPGTLHLGTMLLHSSGEWVKSVLAMPVTKSAPQGYGSALTYARRYGLAALLGITQEDDDADAATRPAAARESKPSSAAPTQAPQTEKTGTPKRASEPNKHGLSEAQIKRIFGVANGNGVSPDAVRGLHVRCLRLCF